MKRPVRVFIADDEFQSRQVIIKLLDRYFTDFEVVGQAAAVEEAISGITDNHPDILFLDVRLNGQTGFQVLDGLGSTDLHVIFTTAYEEYAVRAFRYSALDYLIKPIDPGELRTAVDKAMVRIKERESAPDTTSRRYADKIAIPSPEGLLFVDAADIIYCQAQSNYTELFLIDGQKLTSSYTLKSFEDLLTGRDFFRTHKSFLINLKHIDTYRKGEGGVVVMSNGREIEVARRNKSGFLNLFKGQG